MDAMRIYSELILGKTDPGLQAPATKYEKSGEEK
jgi:hypothetical protein